MTSPNQFSYNKFLLRFDNRKTERSYQETVLGRTKTFNCLAWCIAFFLSAVFGFLDKTFFPDQFLSVQIVRACYVLLALIMVAANIRLSSLYILRYNPLIFIVATGLFCIFLISCTDPTLFSPYFLGIFFVFTGIFFSAGLGFQYSLLANIFIVSCFVVIFGFFIHLEVSLYIIYIFFLVALLLVFEFVDYLVERLLRENFISTSKLQESLANVRQLSGLLPICSSCKKVRDDQGYWKQLETYIQTYSDVLFTHGLCQDCKDELYGSQEWYKKMQNSSNPEANLPTDEDL
jgi:hypothetical protein